MEDLSSASLSYGMECFGGLDRSNQRFLICSNFHERIDSTRVMTNLPAVEISFNLTPTSTAMDGKVSTVLI